MTGARALLERAEPGDAEAIAQVHVSSWKAAYAGILPSAYLTALSVEARATLWQRSIEAGVPEIWVARLGSRLEAFVAFGKCRDELVVGQVGEIWAIYARRCAWGMGLGRSLCERALERLTEDGFERVSLWVFENNPRARRFYEGAGFEAEPASVKTFPIAGITAREIRYARQLGALAESS
jgi:ribosomal protein S18 acetylase RimI-like enzyme